MKVNEWEICNKCYKEPFVLLKEKIYLGGRKKFPFPLNMMNYITSVTQMANYVSTDYLNDFGKRWHTTYTHIQRERKFFLSTMKI